jgi:hypothetical protein
MTGVTDPHPAAGLHPFRDGIDKDHLFSSVLVQEEMQLVEGRPTHEPMVFLVERVQDLRAYFGANRSVVSGESDQLFRLNPISRFGAIRSP